MWGARVAGAGCAAGAAAVWLALLAALAWPPPNLCGEGAERPRYTAVAVDGAAEFPEYYQLLRVQEQEGPPAPAAEAPAAEAPAHAAVLFVPGNAGAHTQAKSLAAEAAKAGLPLDFYAVGLGAELVAFRGQLLARQARFVRRAVDTLRRLRGEEGRLLAVGHSMGGLALRAALRGGGGAELLLTLGTPNAAPVVATEASLPAFYAALARSAPGAVPVLSVAGGERDIQVPEHLCELPDGAESRALSLGAQGIRGVRGSVDHQCLSWCLPLAHRLNELLAAAGQAGAAAAFESVRPGELLWAAPSTAQLTTVRVQPASALRRESPVTLGGRDAGASSGYRLVVRGQRLAVPQRLILRCPAAAAAPAVYLDGAAGPPLRCAAAPRPAPHCLR